MRGVILAGGEGTRLRPTTLAVSKQLLPVYDKPMIYYPLSVLMLAEIREILVITTPGAASAFEYLLGNGAKWGLTISYAQQTRPIGIADAFWVGQDFIAGEPVCLILGDNLFFGHGMQTMLRGATRLHDGALIFACEVGNPERYGVVELAPDGHPVSIEEKPDNPKSHYAVVGLYFYDGRASAFAKRLKPSPRGELEITDLNQMYLERGELGVEILGRGITWMDAGTHDALLQASNFVQAVETRQGRKIACPEEIAEQKGWV